MVTYYKEQQVYENVYIRTFFPDLEPIWHKDLEDRIVFSPLETNWKFQLDNQLPIEITQNEKLFIQKNTFHRLISDNKEDLVLFIEKK